MIRQAVRITVRGPMEQKWYEIALPVAPEHGEAAAAMLTARGGFAGCELRERGAAVHVVVFAQAASLENARAAADEAATLLKGPALLEGSAETIITELDPEVWTQNWRRHFARHTIGGRIEIVPPWEEPSPPSAGLISIVINPGMAFGTGLHETTSGCLEALIANVRGGERVLDLGCGSAILAIAAARLGAQEALALDNDPVAVAAAEENIAANLMGGVVTARLVASQSEAVGTDVATEGQAQRFDLVVANILAETLVEMQDLLTVSVEENGVLILSGIEASRLHMVLKAFVRPGWSLGDILERGEWATVVLHHGALAPRSRES